MIYIVWFGLLSLCTELMAIYLFGTGEFLSGYISLVICVACTTMTFKAIEAMRKT